MLKAANVSPADTIKLFNQAGVPLGLLVPTATGYKKSIMDATLSFRAFLHETGIHEYSTQAQGQGAKVVVPAHFVFPDRCTNANATLYRPCTKKGDPRIWFSHLTGYCRPTDLLAVMAYNNELYVFNMSNQNIVSAFALPGTAPHELLSNCSQVLSPVATELLARLREIHAQGFIKGVGSSDTNVGKTLESLLGIAPNNSKAPDYQGIELKASRKTDAPATKINKSKHTTLFTNVPDWNRSPFDAARLLETFGYIRDGKRQLRCTVSNVRNPQGLYLSAENEIDLVNKAQTPQYTGDVLIWAISTLQQRLAEKHKETFWVSASSRMCNGKEYFRYDSVCHTRSPNVANMATLFDTGIITLDLVMNFKNEAARTVRDHGYLFRTKRKFFRLIFPIERTYDL